MSHATFYTDQTAFLNAISNTYYQEDFHAYDGTTTTLSSLAGAGNGYSWTATATGPGTNLLNTVHPGGNGALSVLNSGNALNFAFGPSTPVTAFGGFFYNASDTGNPADGQVTLTLSSGQQETANINGSTSFLGYVAANSSATILNASISGISEVSNARITADHVITGQIAPPASTPEPFTMGLGLASAALFVRRRLKTKWA